MMKRFKLVFVCMLFTFLSTAAIAAPTTGEEAKATTTKLTEAEANVLFERLEEIDEIDKSDMTFKEKRALRKEVKEIKRELKDSGLYISTGAAIIIILLLILLL